MRGSYWGVPQLWLELGHSRLSSLFSQQNVSLSKKVDQSLVCWCITNPWKTQIETTNYNRDKRTSPDKGRFWLWGLPVVGNQGFSCNSLNKSETIERWVATLMKTGCARTASCLSVTGHGLHTTVSDCTPTIPEYARLYPKTGGFGLPRCSGKNKVGKRRRRSPCLAFVIAMADDDNVVRPTQLTCILEIYVNRQIQKTRNANLLMVIMPIILLDFYYILTNSFFEEYNLTKKSCRKAP